MELLYQFNEADLLYDSTCGEVVIDSTEPSAGENGLYGAMQDSGCEQTAACYQNVGLDDCDNNEYSTSSQTLKCGLASSAACSMTRFHSVVQVQKHDLTADFQTDQSVDEEKTGACVQQRVIIVASGNDPQTEMNLAIKKITEELNRKASEAMTNGINPDPETIIEITTVVESSEQQSMPFQRTHTRNPGLGRENIPPAAGTTFVQTSRNLSLKYEPSVLTVHNRDYKTPSPLVPWDRQYPVVDKSGDTDLSCDLYFQPSSVDSTTNATDAAESLFNENFVEHSFETFPVDVEASFMDIANDSSRKSSITQDITDSDNSAPNLRDDLERPVWHPVELVACG
jgi:hypothetical protein